MGLLDKFTKISAQDPLKRLVEQATKGIQDQIENSVQDLFSASLKKIGFSSGVANELSSRFGDSYRNGSADRYFRNSSSGIERLSVTEICNNLFPKYAKMSSTVDERSRYDKNIDALKGVDGATLQFPPQLGKYYVSLKFKKYTRTAPQAPATLEFLNAIALPIPKDLGETHANDISNGTATGLTGYLTDMLMAGEAAMRGGEAAKNDFLSKDTLNNQGAAAAYVFAMGGLNKVGASEITGIVGQVAGAIPNPHLSVFYQGPKLRNFSFEWTFAPRNRRESERLQDICNQLRINSLATFSPTGQAALTYPDLCFIDLHPWASDSDPLIKFKPTLITNVDINYAPNGIPSFFAGTNQPTFIKLKLDFQEVEYFTGEDFGGERRQENLTKARDLLLDAFGVDISSPTGSPPAPETPVTNDNPEITKDTTPPVTTGSKQVSIAKQQAEAMKADQVVRISTVTTGEVTKKVYLGKAGPTLNSVRSDDIGVADLKVAQGNYYIYEVNQIGRSPVGQYSSLNDAMKKLSEMGAIK